MTQQRGMRASSLLQYKADLLLASDAMAAAVAACTGSSEVALHQTLRARALFRAA